jgi:hypothetical protein
MVPTTIATRNDRFGIPSENEYKSACLRVAMAQYRSGLIPVSRVCNLATAFGERVDAES